MTKTASPTITHVSWGRMEVEGLGVGKDWKLWPGGGREWDWGETGTRHEPGIQPADVEELLEYGSRVIVLTKGMQRRLSVEPETLDHLTRREIAFHVAETNRAVDLYNDLASRGEAVGGLFHSTC